MARYFSPGQSTIEFSNGASVSVRPQADPDFFWPRGLTQTDKDWLIYGWAKVLSSLYDGKLPFHASSVAVQNRVISIAGPSGSGKSTSIFGLHLRGHDVVVDDVSVFSTTSRKDGVEQILVEPFSRPIHLMETALSLLGQVHGQWQRMSAYPVKGSVAHQISSGSARVVDAIFVLSKKDANGLPSLERLTGIKAFEEIFTNSFRSGATPAILGRERFFSMVSSVANCVPVFELVRHETENQLEEVLNLIESAVSQLD